MYLNQENHFSFSFPAQLRNSTFLRMDIKNSILM